MEIHDHVISDNVEQDVCNLICKIKTVLSKLNSSEFRISDDTILHKLHDCLSKIFSIEEYHAPLLEIFLPWIDFVVTRWKHIQSKTYTFAMRILSLVCLNEEDFSKLLKSAILVNVCCQIINCEENDFSLVQAHLELIASVVSHQSGCLWTLETGIWKKILKIAGTNKSIYALRKAHNVIADLIISSCSKNLSTCHCIIDEVFSPCYNTIKNEKPSLKAFIMKNIPYQKECFNENLNYLNSAVLLRETILKMLNKKFSHSKINGIFEKYSLVEWIYDRISNTENARVMVELSRLLSVLHIGALPHLEDGCVNYSAMHVLRQQFLDHTKLLIRKKQYILIQEVCIDYFKLWNQYGGDVIHDVKEPDVDNNYFFENSLFIILTVPLFIYIRIGQATKSDLMDAYAERIFGVACLQTKRTGYILKDEVRDSRDSGELCIESVATSTVHCFIRIAKVCKKEQAVMIFQTLVHIMRKLIPMNDFIDFPDMKKLCNTEGHQNLTIISPELLSATLEALYCYISSFDFSWSDSLETLCIMPILQKLVSPVITDITPRMCVDGLKVQNVVLLGYLPTNLALLMDTLQGSSLHFLGKQIFRLLHSVDWEVRDSALELLQSICLLAEEKLPVFQKMLVDDNLPSLLASICECDPEAYVRASALSCLSYMVKIQFVWDKALGNELLIEKLLHMVVHDPEGVVRFKAVLLLKEIYGSGCSRPEETDKIMDVLYHVTLMDLHWEVKRGTILFWDTVLEKKLSDIGMVDGEFPDHIFSREKKKIIRLTPNENSLMIQKVFENLGDYGCLYAIWSLIQDDIDLEVTKEAGKLVKKMIDLINKFRVPISSDINMTFYTKDEVENKDNLRRKMSIQESCLENELDTSHDSEFNVRMASSDEVIESIVSEEDINLICGLVKKMDAKENPLILLARKKLTLDEFYHSVVCYDIIGKQIEKARWLHKTSDGINSLLDDILAANQIDQGKNNVIDCY